MNKLKLFAVIAAMTVCGVASAQGNNFAKVSYSNVAIKASAMGLTFTQNLNGVAVGIAQARELPGELPFLYEYGVDLLAAFGDNSTLISAVVPVNLMYRFDFGQIRLLPFAGLNLTAHIIGQDKYDGVTSNWFKKDEDGDVACHRIQLGAQFGAKVLYEKYFFGISYQPSLTRFADSTNLNVLNVSVGLTF